MKPTPLFKQLNTFRIAANCLSFSKTADELCITQAAVSQQIRLLETHLGVVLFDRLARGLQLTKTAQVLQVPINQAFDKIEQALESLTDNYKNILTISILPSLASKWLIPRLVDFNQKHPDISVHINANLALSDFKNDDASIQFGYQPSIGLNNLQAKFLMEEEIFLVASPKLINSSCRFDCVEDLKKQTLLRDTVDCHFEAYGVAREVGWNEFSTILKVDISQCKFLAFTQANLVLQAAIAGQGVAIARSVLVADDLRTGQLVRIYPQYSTQSLGYHWVYPHNSSKLETVKIFEEWLFSTCKKTL
jgi:LysR family glycine cleavage system transcriptional activator